METAVPAVVLGLARERFQHGSLGIMRSLGRWGVEVHGIFRDTDTPACSSRYLSGTHRLVETEPELSIAELVRIGERIGGRPVVYATDDVAAHLLVSNAERLGEGFRFPTPSPDVVSSLGNKEQMAAACARFDVPTPRIVVPADEGAARAALEEVGLPVVVKAIDAALVQTASGTSVAIAHVAEEAMMRFREMSGEVAGNVLLQELIPGGPEQVWMFNGYFGSDGRCRAAFSGRKIRQFPPYTGMTSLGECRDVPEVVELATRLLSGLGYEGPVDLGMRFDPRDSRYKMLDVNPRMGATFRLFVDDEGMDVARVMYLDLTGQDAGQPRPVVEGRKWIIEHFDVVSSISYMRDGKLGVRAWLSSLRGIREGAWFARDDLKPFLKMMGDGVRMLLRWVTRKVKRR